MSEIAKYIALEPLAIHVTWIVVCYCFYKMGYHRGKYTGMLSAFPVLQDITDECRQFSETQQEEIRNLRAAIYRS